MIANKYQTKIYDEIQNGTGNIVVQAKAGTGKTTTIVNGMNYVPTDKKVAFLAFNKHIAETLAKKAPKNAKVATIHSMGFAAIRKAYGRVKVNNSKLFYLLKDYNEGDSKAREKIQWGLKVIPLLKANLLDATEDNIYDVCAHHSINFPDFDAVHMCKNVLKQAAARKNMIDFDDMVWMPVVNNLICDKYDYIFVDESQDLTLCNTELVLKFGTPSSRYVFVGDQHQALYGFRGSYIDAMDMIKRRTNAQELPLSICYRCPKSHVELAQKFVPEIEAAPDAPEGNIENICVDDMMDYVSPDDLCVCRNNAPLVAPAFTLLREGIKVCIRGKDIGKNLINLIKGFKTQDIDKMCAGLNDWYGEELAKARARNINPANIDDKYECVLTFVDVANPTNVDDLVDHIENIFDDKRAQVTFSSIHKAKGLEANNVFVLFPELMPSKFAQQEWEYQQEANIEYVAYTRAKENLYMVIH